MEHKHCINSNSDSQIVTVKLKERSYDITIGANLLADPNSFSSLKKASKVMIVTNTTVAALYLDVVQKTIEQLGLEVHSIALEDGENYKNLTAVNDIYSALLVNNFARDSMIVALGGGVVGDIAGFAAASFLRGIKFIQIPTTLLAQVDSSVGGKTGVNHALGKNMIGAFYQPQAVIIDTNTLKTLEKRQIFAGLSEVIKYGAILDKDFFDYLSENIEKLVAVNPEPMIYTIKRCCEIKADVVSQDEKEAGLRGLLNFGHTFGHAIEAFMGYGRWLHGEAIAAGMVMAAHLSSQLGYISLADVKRLIALFKRANLPTFSPDIMKAEQYLPYMKRDKKVLAQKMRLILLKNIGQAYIADDINEEQILTAINSCEPYDRSSHLAINNTFSNNC